MKYLLLIAFIAFEACNIAGDNSNEIISEISNNRGRKAVLFKKYGGATVPNSIQVALLEDDEKLSNEQVGNVFTCNESSIVELKWLSNDSLGIQYSKKAKTYIRQKKVDHITIVYKAQ
jgi:hypothetical protein